MRLEDWEFNGSKVILELTLKQVTPAGDIVIVLKSHGCQLDTKEVNIHGDGSTYVSEAGGAPSRFV